MSWKSRDFPLQYRDFLHLKSDFPHLKSDFPQTESGLPNLLSSTAFRFLRRFSDFLQWLSTFSNRFPIFSNGFPLSEKSEKIYLWQEVYKRLLFEFCRYGFSWKPISTYMSSTLARLCGEWQLVLDKIFSVWIFLRKNYEARSGKYKARISDLSHSCHRLFLLWNIAILAGIQSLDSNLSYTCRHR